MRYTRRPYEEQDFITIRDFLKDTLQKAPSLKNWMIDQWNFGRYWGQVMHGTFNTWPETVGIWEDENKEVVAIVNSQGERINRTVGEAFFQLSNRNFTDEFYYELIAYAECKLPLKTEKGLSLRFIVNSNAEQIKNILKERGYALQDLAVPMSHMDINNDLKVELPEGFKIVDANEVSDYQKGFAHGRAFGYYKSNVPDDDDAERCYKSLRKAPDYIPELDLSVLDQNGEVASFSGVWYDDLNRIAQLEPVGTIPKYRRMGLAKAVIYEGINRARKMGANKVYVGSNQQFYLSIGFSIAYSKEVWQKEENL
jgi:predicted N-acetyltransferase YhbS